MPNFSRSDSLGIRQICINVRRWLTDGRFYGNVWDTAEYDKRSAQENSGTPACRRSNTLRRPQAAEAGMGTETVRGCDSGEAHGTGAEGATRPGREAANTPAAANLSGKRTEEAAGTGLRRAPFRAWGQPGPALCLPLGPGEILPGPFFCPHSAPSVWNPRIQARKAREQRE